MQHLTLSEYLTYVCSEDIAIIKTSCTTPAEAREHRLMEMMVTTFVDEYGGDQDGSSFGQVADSLTAGMFTDYQAGVI